MYDIQAITRDDEIAIVYIRRPPNVPGLAYRTFSHLAQGSVDVDIILQTASFGRDVDIIFTVHKEDMEHTRDLLEAFFADHAATEIEIDPSAVKLAVAGEGMQGRPGVAARVFKCLWDEGVRIINISTSEIKICMLIAQADADKAAKALYAEFGV